MIVKDGRMVKNTAYGYVNAYNRDGSHIADPVHTTVDTMYDLASNTKMYATNLSLEKLVDEGKLDINQKITDFSRIFGTRRERRYAERRSCGWWICCTTRRASRPDRNFTARTWTWTIRLRTA